MRYQRCIHFDEGHCYNAGLRNGLPTLGCVGYDRCEHYEIEEKLPLSASIEPHNTGRTKLSRPDIVGQNGNDGEVYLVEKVCRIIAGDNANQMLGGFSKGKKRWENHIKQAMEIINVVSTNKSVVEATTKERLHEQ